MGFRKAVKSQAWLRLALVGPSGSGKTYSALNLATELAHGKPIAVVDTERGSASKYADIFTFDVLELDNFHPSRYIDAISDAVAGGYGVVVLDSLSHAWNGTGGILEIVQRYGGKYTDWSKVKPIENALIEAITGSPIHVIATMRSKSEYVVEQDERGKATPKKVGMAPVQRDGIEFEFDVYGMLDQQNTLTIEKTRVPALTNQMIVKPGKPMADVLWAWLTSGAPIEQSPVPALEPTPHATSTINIPAPTATETPVDPWAEVRTLATELGLSDGERQVLFAKHKKGRVADRDAILKELNQRKAGKKSETTTSGTVDAMEAEHDLTEMGTVVP